MKRQVVLTFDLPDTYDDYDTQNMVNKWLFGDDMPDEVEIVQAELALESLHGNFSLISMTPQ